MSGERILVVDDEPQIRRALRTALSGHGYAVEVAADGTECVQLAATWQPDALLLDLVMPQPDGFATLRELRSWSDVPVIVLSARGEELDKVAALDLGADDYLTKPFGMAELLARLRAVLRRMRHEDTASIVAGTVTIDLARHVVTRKGEEVHLTRTEFALLRALAADAGKVLTHRQLHERAWGDDQLEGNERLRVYVNYLRRKLEDDPARPALIVTEPGVGYRLRLPDR